MFFTLMYFKFILSGSGIITLITNVPNPFMFAFYVSFQKIGPCGRIVTHSTRKPHSFMHILPVLFQIELFGRGVITLITEIFQPVVSDEFVLFEVTDRCCEMVA